MCVQWYRKKSINIYIMRLITLIITDTFKWLRDFLCFSFLLPKREKRKFCRYIVHCYWNCRLGTWTKCMLMISINQMSHVLVKGGKNSLTAETGADCHKIKLLICKKFKYSLIKNKLLQSKLLSLGQIFSFLNCQNFWLKFIFYNFEFFEI